MFYNGIEYGQCEVSDFQDLIDAMVAEGILVADDPRMLFTCEECGLVSARSSVHMCRPNKGSDIRGQIVP
jgi:hypothetical protein